MKQCGPKSYTSPPRSLADQSSGTFQVLEFGLLEASTTRLVGHAMRLFLAGVIGIGTALVPGAKERLDEFRARASFCRAVPSHHPRPFQVFSFGFRRQLPGALRLPPTLR